MLFVVFLTWILPSAIIHKIEDSQQTAVKRRPTVSPDDQNSPLRTHLRDLNPEENFHAAAAAAKLLPLWPTLCNPIDGSPPGSAVPGILQARTLKWVAISFSNACKWKVKVKSVVCDPQRPHGLQPTRLLGPRNFPGKSTGVGCHCLLRISWHLVFSTWYYICGIYPVLSIAAFY